TEKALTLGGKKVPNVWEPSMRFGLVTLPEKDGARAAKPKRLTYSPFGETNNVCIRLDGQELLFGDLPVRDPRGNLLRVTFLEGHLAGEWQDRDVRLGMAPWGRPFEGRKSVWIYNEQQVVVTQTVEIVSGAQSRLLDTCLIRYDLENRDTRAHKVGLR